MKRTYLPILCKAHRSQGSLHALVLFLLGVVVLPASSLGQPYQMRTVVKDFVTTSWTLECPDGGILDLTTVDLTDQGIMAFMQCLNQIESEVGVKIESNTIVRDFVVESDEVISTTSMSADQVAKLKDVIEKNRIPVNAFPRTRARIQSVLLNGVLDSFIIDLGNGCIIDLTDVELDPQVLQALIQLLQQFETENGSHVSGATTVKDGVTEKDRVVQVTHLTEPQIQRLFQFFQFHQIAVVFFQKWVNVHLTGTLFLNGNTLPLDLSGRLLFQAPPPDPQTGQQPLEVIDLQLTSADPLGPTLGLAPEPEPWLFMLDPLNPDGTLHLFFGQLPTLVLQNAGPNQQVLVGHPDFPQDFEFVGSGTWPNFKALNLFSPGLKHLTMPGGSQQPQPGPTPVAGALQIDCFELGLPLRVPVIPGGLGQ